MPVCHGPTWQEDPAWDGLDSTARYLLPKHTLGWQIIAWVERWLCSDESTDDHRVPFRLTFEQKRFILWWYAIDERGRWLYRDGVLQRLKGWGKDPLASVLCAVEFLGPCRFAGWLTEDRPDLGLFAGDPLGQENPRAWIQIAAVTQEQTTNTMSLFPSLFSKELMKLHGMRKDSIGKTVIYAHAGQRRIQAVTSSPRALEGGRPTFVIRNETHHWLRGNEGHAMDAVIERNLTKSKGGRARALSITNAYEPSEDSVAQRVREAWEAEDSGQTFDTGVLYDSLEAPRDAKIYIKQVLDTDTGEVREPTEAEVKAYIGAVLEAVRGDATWLDVETITNSILSRKNPLSQSRRFYYNQVVAAEDAWVDPVAVDLAIHAMARDARAVVGESDMLRAGWIVAPDSPCTAFLDGSKSRDATGIVLCEISTGYTFTGGVWANPGGDKDRDRVWRVPRDQVDARVNELFERFTIVGFGADPSHAKDDDSTEDDLRFWDPYIDRWHLRYKDRLRWWATKTGDRTHSIMWDMTSPLRAAAFVGAAERFVSDLENKNDIEELEPTFSIDGYPALVAHLKNAIQNPTRWGISLAKESHDSPKKIDLAVCAVGARMIRQVMLNVDRDDEPKGKKAGQVWGAW